MRCVVDKVKMIWGIVVDLVFPKRCPICDKPVKPMGSLICDGCFTWIRFVRGPRCYKCGKPLSDNTKEYCEDCTRHTHEYISGRAVFEYKSVSDAIYRFKYKNRQEYAEFFGNTMAKELGDWLIGIHAQALVPVPIHKSKLKTRGYNQAELIAKALSKRTGIPVRSNLIIRSKKTNPLKDLRPVERNNNLRGAFKIVPSGVKLETIVIIDDIYTTGSTIDAVAKVFKASGVSNIYFATLAIGRGV